MRQILLTVCPTDATMFAQNCPLFAGFKPLEPAQPSQGIPNAELVCMVEERAARALDQPVLEIGFKPARIGAPEHCVIMTHANGVRQTIAANHVANLGRQRDRVLFDDHHRQAQRIMHIGKDDAGQGKIIHQRKQRPRYAARPRRPRAFKGHQLHV